MGLFDKIGTRLFPIWRHSSILLAVESTLVAAPAAHAGDGPYRVAEETRARRVTALVYSGQREVAGGHRFVVRRVELDGDARLRVVWEESAPEPGILVPERYGRLGDRIIVPLGAGGVRALDLRTGRQVWIHPYAAPVAAPPERLDDGDLLVRFLDGAWARIAPATGLAVEQGWGVAPAGRRLIDVRGIEDAPVAERLTWASFPDGRDALGVLEPSGETRWVLTVDTRAAVCRFDGCHAVDGMLVVRASILERGATIGRRASHLCDPRTWALLARLPGPDATTSEIHSPKWLGRL